MSWVSQANIKTIMTAIRNKFTTSDLVIANDAKDTGVELNYASQDGLVTVSPISTSASTEAALHLSNGDDTKKTELTQGTLSYVTGTGSSETYNYMSLLGDGVTFGKNGGGNVQVGGIATPTTDYQAANKTYVDNKFYTRDGTIGTFPSADLIIPANGEATISDIGSYDVSTAYTLLSLFVYCTSLPSGITSYCTMSRASSTSSIRIVVHLVNSTDSSITVSKSMLNIHACVILLKK